MNIKRCSVSDRFPYKKKLPLYFKMIRTKYFIYAAAIIIVIIYSCHKSEKPTVQKTTTTTPKDTTKTSTPSAIAYQDTIATEWFKRDANSLGSVAFDDAFSIPLANGKVLWLTGDTYYADLNADGTTPCIFNYHNTVLQQPSTSNWVQSATTNLLTGSGSPQIFNALNINNTTNNYFWPLSGVEINGKVYIYLYKNNGATAGAPKLGILNETTNAVDTTTVTLPPLNGINFGTSMFKVGTTIYLYGAYIVDGYGDTRVYAAQFSITGGGLTFWNGTTWSSTCPDPTVNSPAVVANTLSNALNVSYVNGKFVMIATQFLYNCDGGTAIYATASTSPTSGFGNLMNKVIYNIPDRRLGTDGKFHTPVFYSPLIHPEFTANNAFLFTYCINHYDNSIHSCNIPMCTSNETDPDDYRPRAVRVPFSVLDL